MVTRSTGSRGSLVVLAVNPGGRVKRAPTYSQVPGASDVAAEACVAAGADPLWGTHPARVNRTPTRRRLTGRRLREDAALLDRPRHALYRDDEGGLAVARVVGL